MKKIMTILMLKFLGLTSLMLVSMSVAQAQTPPPVSVGVYASHLGNKLVYHYRVINNSRDNIAVVRIGYDSKNDNNNNNNAWELLELPSGWDPDTGIPPASATSPSGWRVYVITLEESELLGIIWETVDDNSPRLLPGQTFTEMSITLDKADVNYITGHAFIRFPDKPQQPTSLTVPLERLDTTPPTLTITPTPASLWPPNHKMVAVTAAITVKDDYDPEPEIKLESITSSEVPAPGDIQGAVFGTDDRSVSLVATRAVTNPAGRVYTLAYSATDASGNQSTARTTVTVPHDQR